MKTDFTKISITNNVSKYNYFLKKNANIVSFKLELFPVFHVMNYKNTTTTSYENDFGSLLYIPIIHMNLFH